MAPRDIPNAPRCWRDALGAVILLVALAGCQSLPLAATTPTDTAPGELVVTVGIHEEPHQMLLVAFTFYAHGKRVAFGQGERLICAGARLQPNNDIVGALSQSLAYPTQPYVCDYEDSQGHATLFTLPLPPLVQYIFPVSGATVARGNLLTVRYQPGNGATMTGGADNGIGTAGVTGTAQADNGAYLLRGTSALHAGPGSVYLIRTLQANVPATGFQALALVAVTTTTIPVIWT